MVVGAASERASELRVLISGCGSLIGIGKRNTGPRKVMADGYTNTRSLAQT